MNKFLFPLLIVVLYAGAAGMSFAVKDYKNMAYSLIAAMLNAVVYFWK